MIQLGVNIDHIATLRNARGTSYPSLETAAGIIENNGGDFITIHLREDRRHIKEKDLFLLVDTVTTFINLEMACNENVLSHALIARPLKATLVPEKREELTTEGGLNIKDNFDKISDYVKELQNNGTIVSLFIEPDVKQLELYMKTGADEVEIHTGHYADSPYKEQFEILKNIQKFTSEANKAGVRVCAGHGLNYHNIHPICKMKGIEELNIGHSIISMAVFLGLDQAVIKMKQLIREAEMLC